MLSRLVITFLPRSKHLLISWLQSPSAVILEPKKRKSDTVSTVSPSISHEVMGPDAMILVFWMLSFKSTFHSPLSLSSRGFLVPLHFLPLEWYHLHICISPMYNMHIACISSRYIAFKNTSLGDFPGGSVAKTLSSQSSRLRMIPGQGTRSHMSQLKITCATTKTWSRQIN